MKLSTFAAAVFSLAVANSAYAESDKNRVLIEGRWYSEAYIKEHLSHSNPKLLRAAFQKAVTYAFAADGPGFRREGANLLTKPIKTRQGDFLRWPPKEAGQNLATELDKKCVTRIALGLRSLAQTAVQRTIGQQRKGIVVAEIQTGELTSAPLDLSRTVGRPISVIPPSGDGKMLCNIYKTIRSGKDTYDVSVVFITNAAYSRGY
ncbi:MAG: hypothetical protein RSD81_00930 [Pseudomonas sp.]